MNINKFTTYKYKSKLGYLGDFETEWWTDKDWEKHKEYVKQLKKEGRLGEEVEGTITMMYIPEYDNSTLKHNTPLESHRLVFVDFNEQ